MLQNQTLHFAQEINNQSKEMKKGNKEDWYSLIFGVYNPGGKPKDWSQPRDGVQIGFTEK